MEHHYLIQYYSFCAVSRDKSCAIKIYGDDDIQLNQPISEEQLSKLVDNRREQINQSHHKRDVFARVFERVDICRESD